MTDPGQNSDELNEAILQKIVSGALDEMGGPRYPRTIDSPDPDYHEIEPGLADWWRARLAMPATLILKCGINECKKLVGEVKTDDDSVIILLGRRFGKRTVPVFPPVTEESLGFPPRTVLRDTATGETLAQMNQRKRAELAAETLGPLGEDRREAKRFTATPILARLEHLEQIGDIYGCPDHSPWELPDPAATVAEMRQFLAKPETGHAAKWSYVLFRGNRLS